MSTRRPPEEERGAPAQPPWLGPPALGNPRHRAANSLDHRAPADAEPVLDHGESPAGHMPASTAGPEPRHDAGGTDADAPPQDWRDQALAAGYLPPPAPSWPIGAPPLPPPGWVPPPPAMVAPNDPVPQSYWVPDALDGQEMIDRGSAAPQRGWRRLLHTVSGGRINPGDSRKDREQDALIATIRYPLSGDFRIAVLSIKGGVGKTTTTLGLGSALAMARSDRVIAVDANPDRGTLAERVLDPSTQSTVRDLLRDSNIHRYADVRNHTRMAISRLEVLASEQDPAVAEVFGDRDYRRTIDILRHYYNVILTDCGTGIMHSAMEGVLDLAHAIVLVTAPAIDAVLSASATLDWLDQHGHSDLVREAHVVFSAAAPASDRMVIDKARAHFEARCRSIHFVPFDQHLAEGADIDFAMLKPATMRAYLGLAGAIAQKFPAAATTTG